jgi:hypothetical protein
MNKGIELRLKYNQLIIEGKTEEAWKILNQIWDLDKGIVNFKDIKIEKTKPIEELVEIAEKEVIIPSKFKTISDLSKIHGVGKGTVKQLEYIYGTLDNLVDVMKKGVNLKTRDDIEEKIKKGLNL